MKTTCGNPLTHFLFFQRIDIAELTTLDCFLSQTPFDPLFSMNGFGGAGVASQFKTFAGMVRHVIGCQGDNGKRAPSAS
jgi:hypothetical protein